MTLIQKFTWYESCYARNAGGMCFWSAILNATLEYFPHAFLTHFRFKFPFQGIYSYKISECRCSGYSDCIISYDYSVITYFSVMKFKITPDWKIIPLWNRQQQCGGSTNLWGVSDTSASMDLRHNTHIKPHKNPSDRSKAFGACS